MSKVLWFTAKGAAFASVVVLVFLAFMGLMLGPMALVMHFNSLWWLLLYTPMVLAALYQIGKDYV